jgi:hypothetical protein
MTSIGIDVHGILMKYHTQNIGKNDTQGCPYK